MSHDFQLNCENSIITLFCFTTELYLFPLPRVKLEFGIITNETEYGLYLPL